jgi:hypothetical protein
VNQIRNISNVTGCAAAGFQDASVWEEAKKKGNSTIKALIHKGLENTAVTVVCVGYKTAGRTYINYEIDRPSGAGMALSRFRSITCSTRAATPIPPERSPPRSQQTGTSLQVR